MWLGLADKTASVIDTALNPRKALDDLAQHSQEDIAFGLGEVVGETAASAGIAKLGVAFLGKAKKSIGNYRKKRSNRLKNNNQKPRQVDESHPEFLDDRYIEKQSSLRRKLDGLVANDEQLLRSTVSKTQRGKKLIVTARALDPLTGKISEAYQNVKGLPDDLDDLLKDRANAIEKLPKEKRHPSDPGTHAEILALDELIKARRAMGLKVNMSDFVTQQRWLTGNSRPAKTCLNCSIIATETQSMAGKNWKYPPDKY